MRVLMSVLPAVSTVTQAEIIKKLIEEKGYEAVFKKNITIFDLKDDDNKAFLWFTLAAWPFMADGVLTYLQCSKGKAIYLTIEGIPTKANFRHTPAYRAEYIANSNFTAKMLRHAGLKVIDVIHHAIDLKMCNDALRDAERLKQRLKAKYPNKCIITYVGRHDPRKGLHLLRQAVEILDLEGEKRYVLLMHTDPSASNLQWPENVQIISHFGSKSYFEILKLMAASDYTVFPSVCVPPDTKVVCYDRVKQISEVREGDLVLTHKGRFRRVRKVMRRFYEGELVGIRPRKYNRILWFTPEHPILVARITWRWNKPHKWDKYPPNFTPMWIPAGKLSEKFAVTVPKIRDDDVTIRPYELLEDVTIVGNSIFSVGRNQFGNEFVHPSSKPIPAEIIPDNDFLALSGLYIAEGCFTRDGFALSFGSFEKDLIEQSCFLMEKYGINPRVVNLERHRTAIFGCHRLLGRLLLKLYGKGAREKELPPFLLQLPRNKLEILIQHMFMGDGYTNKKNIKEYTTVSENLAIETFLAIAKLGYMPSLYDQRNINHGLRISWKEESRIHYAKQNEKYVFLPIEQVYRKHYRGYVYNLEVEEDNSYVTEVIAVHNCEGFGLPVLESMAVKTPVIHCWFEPLSEFSTPDGNFVFDPIETKFVANKTPSGIIQQWLFHLYDPEHLADMIKYAIDVYFNSPEEYANYCEIVYETAKNWDYHKVYPKLLKHLKL